jgi:CRP-like cAMP-binding protein
MTTTQTYALFLSQYRVKSYKKGEIILCEGEIPPAGYVIKKGVVKSYNITSEGQEKPITFDVEHEPFPIGWVFHRIRQAQYFYEALTDCEVYCVPRDELAEHLTANPTMLRASFDSLLKSYLNFQMRINALEQSKAANKVIHTLHYLAVRFGKNIKPNLVQIGLPLTQQDMANIMGLTRETTGIELKKLERAGVIRYRRQNYLVRSDKLNDLLDVDYGSGLID